MREVIYTIIFLAVVVAIGWFLAEKNKLSQSSSFSEVSDSSNSDILIKASNNGVVKKKQTESTATVDEKKFQSPLDRAKERVTKKPFGIFITPANSPVQPEKFSGYHTGVDFEIFPEELEKEVFVSAVCTGKLLTKRIASGYGGTLVQSCNLDGEPITVVYGHLKLESIKVAVGDDIGVGEALGVLGRAYSTEAGGERKHLHLGMHKGQEINILGYVSAESALLSWLDSMLFIK
jgi:hypothetical protein